MEISNTLEYTKLSGAYKDATFTIDICEDGIVWVVKNLSIRQTRFGEATTIQHAEASIRSTVDNGWLFQR